MNENQHYWLNVGICDRGSYSLEFDKYGAMANGSSMMVVDLGRLGGGMPREGASATLEAEVTYLQVI